MSLRGPRTYHGGYAWFHIAWKGDGSMTPAVGEVRETLRDLVRWLAAAPPRLGVDAKRVYLLGFSQGAMMSLGVLRTAPERVAGIVALSGVFDDALFAEPAPDDATARVAVFVGHGTEDDLLPVADGRAVRAFFEPRVRDFTYREYPITHAIGSAEIRDVAAWLATRLNATGAP